jgi:hypothetical protein
MAKNKVGFAGFEAGVSVLSILVQNEMTLHGHRRLAWLGQAIDFGFVGGTVANNYPLGYHAQCFARCHGLISVASFVRRETLLWSSFARPLITALVGTTLPLIIRSNSIGSMPSLAASVKTSVPRVAHKSATCLLNSQTFGSGISGKYESQSGND